MSLDHLTYMPVFRGKTFELRMLDQMLPFIQGYPVVPIVEPVTADTAQLEHVIDYYETFGVPLGVVVNPSVGALRNSPEHLIARVGGNLERNSSAFPVFRIGAGAFDWDWLAKVDHFALVEDRAPCNEAVTTLLSNPGRPPYRLIAHRDDCALDHRLPEARILLGEGFPRRPNAKYPPDEKYRSGPGRQDLRSAAGWADYSIAGEQYQEGGARPHAVAIHITYWDPSERGLRVRHYLSDRTEGPEDTEGKFGEALEKLVADLDDGAQAILETSAISVFRSLHAQGHCPGLGTVKLLCMQHQLETVCSRLKHRKML